MFIERHLDDKIKEEGNVVELALAKRVEQLILKEGAKNKRSSAERLVHRPADGLILLRQTATTKFEATIYEPVVCMVLQGAKETQVGDVKMTLSKRKCIVVSHHTPVITRITKASKTKPYLAVIMQLDVSILRSLYAEVGDLSHNQSARAFEVDDADPRVLGAIERYLETLKEPLDSRVLGPSQRREIHYRLIASAPGGMLRSLLRQDSHASRVSRAIDLIRKRYREPLEIKRIARAAGMSTSSLHKHFKAVTTTTPLQFQKNLRLTEARVLLKAGAHSVSQAAFAVGYESASQFSREYSRKFGSAPAKDLERG